MNDLDEIIDRIIRTSCPGCGCAIDPEVCWCGSETAAHNAWNDGHSPVPYGCRCYYDRSDA